jgi:PAS domain S-box-containing protein
MLLLLNRVVAAAVTSIVVTDPHLPDNPIVFHNPAFGRVTGYLPYEVNGRNCRFLQGPDTDPAAIAEIRSALREERHCHVVLRNYRKDGTPFWNELSISPVHDVNGRLTHFVGVQNDVTMRKEAEAERDALLVQQARIADTLQRALLLTPPSGALYGLEVSTQYEPAWDEAQFGGDFFDAFAITEDQVALVVGDVTGKGLAAAQHTAEVKYALRVLMREYSHPIPAMKRLNRFLMNAQRLDARDANALVCITVAVVDTRTGETSITSAGMEPPLVLRADGSTESVNVGGLLLGMDADAEYHAASVTLREGESLLLATDGITEARRPRRGKEPADFFGYDGLTETAREAAASFTNLEEISRFVVDRAKEFAGGRPQDDVCLLIARRIGTPLNHSSRRADTVAPPAQTPESERLLGPDDASVSAERLRLATAAANIGTWDFNPITNELIWDSRCKAMFGLPPDAPIDYSVFQAGLHPDDRERMEAVIQRALTPESDGEVDDEYRTIGFEDGILRWIAVRGRAFFDADGKAVRLIGTVLDITERHRAAERQRFLSDLVERTRFSIDPDTVVQETLRSVGQFLSLSRYLYADIDEERGTVTISHNYVRDESVSSAVGTWPLAPWGRVLHDLRAGRTVVNRDYRTDPRTIEWEAIYRETDICANVSVPMFRDGKWVAVFSAQMSQTPRDWTEDEVDLLETVTQRMWLTIENARLRRAEQENAARLRAFLREMLYGLTEGRLRLCDTPADLPAELSPVSEPIELQEGVGLKLLRRHLEGAMESLTFPKERSYDLQTAVHEAAMNAVRHAGGGEARLHADREAGIVQVRVHDTGAGIAADQIHRAIERGWTTGGFGHGFWMMLKMADRVYLLTGAEGTTVVLEQDRNAAEPAWLRNHV